MFEDRELLRRFVQEHAEDAFAELVQRHLGLVYGAALRLVAGDAHLAQDVAQTVFTALARKAPALLDCGVLGGWLYACTLNAAANTVRTERRRRNREQEAYAMQEQIHDSAENADWTQVQPVLDDAMRRLKPADRDALLLRFFENRPFAEIGARLSLNENAARMRVERALERLRLQLARRGIRSPATALSAVVAAHALATPPAGFAATVAGVAVAGAGSGGLLAIVAVSLGALTKGQMAVLAVMAAAGLTTVTLQQRAQASLRSDLASHQVQRGQLGPVQPGALQREEGDAELARVQAAAEAGRLQNELAVLRVRLQQAKTRAAALAPVAFPRARGTRILSSDLADTPPQPLERRSPKYPFALRQARITGEAILDFIVDETGAVQEVSVVEATHARFAAAALEAVRQWKYEPALKDGVPVCIRMRIPLRFELSGTVTNWF